MHRVSSVHSQEDTIECVGDIVFVVLTVFIVSGKYIIWCQYHLYSSSDVRSRVGNSNGVTLLPLLEKKLATFLIRYQLFTVTVPIQLLLF
jgi:hypothetical protein